MRHIAATSVLTVSLSLVVLGGCQITIKPSPPPTYAAVNVPGGGATEGYTTEPTPRKKPEHARPLAEMTCLELDATMSGYRQAIQRNAPGNRASPTAAVATGGLLGALGTAAIVQQQRFAYEDNTTLFREALKVYEQRGCGAEVARIRAEEAAQWARMDKWAGSILVEADLGAGNASSQVCAVMATRIVVGIENDLVRGSLTLPAGSASGKLSEIEVPLRGSFDTTNKTLKVESEARYGYRFSGSLKGGRWTAGRCTGTFDLQPLPA